MKNINLAKSFVLFLFVLLVSASFTFAQDAAVKKDCETSKKACCSESKVKTAKHTCTDACKTVGCDAVKAAEAKLSNKHVCADACKTVGCDAVKAAEAKLSGKHECADACKDGCKVSKVDMKDHKCTTDCKDGCTAKS